MMTTIISSNFNQIPFTLINFRKSYYQIEAAHALFIHIKGIKWAARRAYTDCLTTICASFAIGRFVFKNILMTMTNYQIDFKSYHTRSQFNNW